jgi:hypothetical protein
MSTITSPYVPLTTTYSTGTTTVMSAPLSPYTPLQYSTQPTNYIIGNTTLAQTGPSYISNLDPLTIDTPVSPIGYNWPMILGKASKYYVDIDTGVNDNSIVQRDITRYFRYKTLDKWLYGEMTFLLKYLKVENRNVVLVKSRQEMEDNKVSKNTVSELEEKSDYIGENILSESAMREILVKIMYQLGIKWYDLPYHEELVKEVIEKYIKKKLKKHLE